MGRLAAMSLTWWHCPQSGHNPSRMRFGFHLSTAGGFLRTLDLARERECEAFQMFAANPRGWRRYPMDPDHVLAFREARSKTEFVPLVVHTTYLVNLASL